MLHLLFPRLTAARDRGTELFRAVTERARAPHWYVAGEVPDTVDGRFAMVATIAALVLVRLEHDGEEADAASATLTEQFVAAMEAEHREMGMGDPTLGRTVRKLVGLLARRVELWRGAVGAKWAEPARQSVYNGSEPTADALAHTSDALAALWRELESSPLEALAEGRIG
jgi:cytochrome b pre-mRNA-processing protein 3